ncbi:MAG: transglycosylase SLT domain-containing protein [bacterium]|nr:transglycosylase SLT domain-containing protein [bacterium]
MSNVKSIDPSGLTSQIKKPNATQEDERKKEQVAKQFESILLATMIREMRGSTNLFSGSDPSAQMFDTTFDTALAEQFSGTLGLRKVIIEALDRAKKTSPTFEAKKEFSGKITQWDPLVEKISQEEKVDANLLRAVMHQESGGKRYAVSKSGACGLMQLMPGTADSVGVTNIFDPEENIRGGAKYLKKQLDRFGNVELALAAYNAGPEAVKRHNGIPPYRETQQYVTAIKNRIVQKFWGNEGDTENE